MHLNFHRDRQQPSDILPHRPFVRKKLKLVALPSRITCFATLGLDAYAPRIQIIITSAIAEVTTIFAQLVSKIAQSALTN